MRHQDDMGTMLDKERKNGGPRLYVPRWIEIMKRKSSCCMYHREATSIK